MARGLELRHDWGPHYRSAHFVGSLAWLGITDSPAFLGEPETNGCAERWIRTLKDQCLWAQLHDTIDELRQAVAEFIDRYNRSWLIQRHGYRTPREAYQAAQSAPSAFRLETLPAYNVPQEAEMLAKLKRGEPVDLPDDYPWLQRARHHCGAGKLMRRVRVVSYPLTDYLRMELSWYLKSVQAGEDIRITETRLSGDFWPTNEPLWCFTTTAREASRARQQSREVSPAT